MFCIYGSNNNDGNAVTVISDEEIDSMGLPKHLRHVLIDFFDLE